MNKKQVRAQFRESVFARDDHKCVICKGPAIDAHHIIDRSLFPDGGYFIDNGVSLCERHHVQAEKGQLSCDELRRAAKIIIIVLPPGSDASKQYDKWGHCARC